MSSFLANCSKSNERLNVLEKQPPNCPPYSTTEVRHLVEDAVAQVHVFYFQFPILQILTTEFKFKENTTFEDRYLILGYTACAFALYGAVYGYLNKFNDAQGVTLVCVTA